jgi:hypothetical protein
MAGDIELAKKLFGTVSSTSGSSRTNSFNASSVGASSTSGTGGSGSDILTQLKYGTCQTDSDGRMVSVLVDGNEDPIDVTTYETLYKGDRVCLITKGSSYKLIAFKAGSIGGNMISVDGAFIDKLVSSEAFIENLTADSAFIGDLTANSAFIEALSTNFIQTDELDATYARLDVANVNKEFVDTLLVQGEYIAQEGTVYYLTGLHIDANDITAGTLTVDRIAVKGDDDEYYMLTPNGDGTFAQTKLNGTILEEQSIKADRIVSNSITTEQITTQNLVGTGGWINLASGTFEYMNASTGNGIAWDGEKLTLHLDEFYVDGSKVATADELSNLQNATIKDVQLEYYLSESPTELSGGGWSSDSAWYSGRYLWQRSKVIYGDGTISYLPSEDGVCVTGNDGSSGKGISSIVEYYAVNSSSTTAPTEWFTSPQSTTETNRYLWNYSEITYTDGTSDSTAKRIIGTQGTKGTNAADSGYLTWNSSTSTLTVGNTNVSSYGKLDITPSAVNIKNSSGTTLAKMNGSGFVTYDSSGTQLASISNNTLELGRVYTTYTPDNGSETAGYIPLLTIDASTNTNDSSSSPRVVRYYCGPRYGGHTFYARDNEDGQNMEVMSISAGMEGYVDVSGYFSAKYITENGYDNVNTNNLASALNGTILTGNLYHVGNAYGDNKYIHTGILSDYFSAGTGLSKSTTTDNAGGVTKITFSSSATDYVTSNGTSNGWRYRKWNSGLIECWCSVSITPSFSTWHTDFYISSSTYGNYAYPFTMSNPSVQMQVKCAQGGWVVTTTAGSSSRCPTCKIAASTNSGGTETMYLDIYCRNSTTSY